LGPENWTRLQKSAKEPGQKLVILPANENRKAIMMQVGRSNFPIRDGNGM
jgi:hypothetical protein